ncbi:MAG TPA: methyltransferase domain-containing protein [Bryobacteraceae bacterium]|nr:methyltransferase domain-containing protein [Bryobacteraceae bacterium]
MEAKFDRYSKNYGDLLRDPIRDAFAGGAGFFHERKWRLLQKFFRDRRLDSTRLRWLDVGSGKGDLLRFGKSDVAQAAGCDPSPGMIEDCADLAIEHQTDPLVLPFTAASFDFITAVCVFHHVEPHDRLALLAEIRRVLAPGGIVSIIEHNPLNPATRLIVKRTPVDAHAKLLRAGEVESLLRESGLTPFEKQYFLYLPEKLYRRAGALENWLKRIPLGGQYAVFGSKGRAASG